MRPAEQINEHHQRPAGDVVAVQRRLDQTLCVAPQKLSKFFGKVEEMKVKTQKSNLKRLTDGTHMQ
jgi:hypothetical protein